MIPDTPIMGFASQARTSNNFSKFMKDASRPGNRDPSRQCTACGRTGHEASGCFTIIGYPEWWEDRSRNRVPQRNTSTKPKDQSKTGAPRANTTTVAKPTTSKIQANITVTDADRLGLSGITDEQWNIVQKLINKGSTNDGHLKGKRDECIWILDTGATHHMTGCLESMENIRDITNIPVLLPAGSGAIWIILLCLSTHIRYYIYVL